MNLATRSASQQRGAILVIVLIMVGVFMIIVTSLVASSNINFRIAGNQQYRMEAKVAARNAIEAYLSESANFSLPLPNADQLLGVDFDGDGVNDMTAIVPPASCTKAKTIQVSELDPTVKADVACLGGKKDHRGIIGSSGAVGGGDSWCSRMNWEVISTVDDIATGASVAMVQGVYTRAVVGTPCPI